MELNRIERVAYLTQTIIIEGRVRTATAADLTGVTPRTIRRDLSALSRVLPIWSDQAGSWYYGHGVPQISPY